MSQCMYRVQTTTSRSQLSPIMWVPESEARLSGLGASIFTWYAISQPKTFIVWFLNMMETMPMVQKKLSATDHPIRGTKNQGKIDLVFEILPDAQGNCSAHGWGSGFWDAYSLFSWLLFQLDQHYRRSNWASMIWNLNSKIWCKWEK